MNYEEIAEFAASIKVGDTVGVYDRSRIIYKDAVVKITPKRYIKLKGGSVFKPNGWKRDSVYKNRYLWKAE